MSSRAGKQPAARQGGQKQKQQQRQQQAQAQTQHRPKTPGNSAQAQAQVVMDQEAKRDARMQRQATARAEAARRRRAKNIRNYGIVAAIVLAFVGVGAYLMVREANKPGQLVDEMGIRNHIQPGENHAPYTTDPPTSGPHVGTVPAWKVYSEPITKELQVHGLEDGGVVINYKPDLDKATVQKLTDLANVYYQNACPNNQVILSPYPGLDHPIVLTAWRRIDRLDSFDVTQIKRFTDEYVGWDHHEGNEGNRVKCP